MNERVAIACQCGTVRGHVHERAFNRRNHLVCYCRDCQAFARFVGNDDTMNHAGGTEIVQVSCADVEFTAGLEAIACINLKPGSLNRFYADCCKTPICNAPGPGLPFIGLIHDCLQPMARIDLDFGPVTMVAFTGSASAEPRPKSRGVPLGLLRFLALALGAKLRGDKAHHPLFASDGTPNIKTRALDDGERDALYQNS